MEKLRNKYVTGVTALGLTLGTLFGSAGQADDVLANGVSEPAAEQMIEEDENSGFYAGADVRYINTNADIEEYRDINRMGKDLTRSWEDVGFDSETQISPAIHIGKNIRNKDNSKVGLEAQLGPKTSNNTFKETRYHDADVGFGNEIADVIHEGDLDALRASLKLKYEQDFGNGSLFLKIGRQLYKVDFDADTEYIFPARNTSVKDSASGTGTGSGYIAEVGGSYYIIDNINAYGNLFLSGGNLELDGERIVRTGSGVIARRDLDDSGRMSSYGGSIGISIDF